MTMGFNPSIKLIVCCLALILLLTVYMMGLLTSEDAELRAYEKFLKESELQRQKREQSKKGIKTKESVIPSDHGKPVDWDVQFISGKDMVNVVEGEHRPIQVHDVTIENLDDMDALVQCKDPFSKFSEIIKSGDKYEFSVTDIFHKRHYWCTVHFGKLVYNFRAYGEGAPRDNNHIMLKKEGAFINGKDMTQHAEADGDHTDKTGSAHA